MLNPRPRPYRAPSESATRPSGSRCGSTFRPVRVAGAVVALAALVAGCTGGAAKTPGAKEPVQSGPSTTPGAGAGTSPVTVVPSTPPARSPDHSALRVEYTPRPEFGLVHPRLEVAGGAILS